MTEYEEVSQDSGSSDIDPENGVNKTSSEVGLGRIYLLSVINFGISAVWTLEMALTTPYFASALSSGPVLSHAIWVLGPISGLLVAPIVGSLSDKCTSPLGRRRPFIIAGAIGTFAGMILFPNARAIAARFVPAHAHQAALVIAVFAFALMDFSINTTMFPVRALQGDLVPEHQQHSVQSATIVMAGLGDLAVSTLVQSYPNPVGNVRALFSTTAVLYATCSIALLIIAKEERHTPNTTSASEKASGRPLSYLRSIPGWLWRAGGAFALGFFSFFLLLPNFSAWLGESVLQGDPSATLGSAARARYEQGIQAVGRAGVVRAGSAIIWAAAYPRLLDLMGAPALLAFAFGVYGIVALALAGTHSLFWGQLMVAAYSLPMTILFTVPMAITVKKSSRMNRGKHLGALNIFAVVPQLIDTTYSGAVSKAFGEAAVIRIGGVWSLLGALFSIVFVRE